MSLEEPKATWDKRYKQRHYAYRDFHQVTTTVLTSVQALALAAQQNPSVYYVFGTNAKNTAPITFPSGVTINPSATALNWPTGCYGREVMVNCDQDVWVRLVSMNLMYLILKAQGLTDAQIAKKGVPKTIMEMEQFIPSGDYIRFYPTLGVAIIFRANTLSSTLNIWVEGNMEGTD